MLITDISIISVKCSPLRYNDCYVMNFSKSSLTEFPKNHMHSFDRFPGESRLHSGLSGGLSLEPESSTHTPYSAGNQQGS